MNKKIKTKWFLIANLIFAILIIGLINVDMVIRLFGGDFEETLEILVIDEVGCFDIFKNHYVISSFFHTNLLVLLILFKPSSDCMASYQ